MTPRALRCNDALTSSKFFEVSRTQLHHTLHPPHSDVMKTLKEVTATKRHRGFPWSGIYVMTEEERSSGVADGSRHWRNLQDPWQVEQLEAQESVLLSIE
jgi:hypothetical protein